MWTYTSCDDTPRAQWTTPRLTSVRQPLVGMGRMAVETVLGMADGNEPASRHRHPSVAPRGRVVGIHAYEAGFRAVVRSTRAQPGRSRS